MEPVAYSNRPSFPASAPRRCVRPAASSSSLHRVLRALSSRRAGFAVRTRYGLLGVLVRGRVGGLEARARRKRSICATNVDGFKRGDVGKRRCCAHVTPGKRAARWTSRIEAHRSTGWTGHPRDCGEDGGGGAGGGSRCEWEPPTKEFPKPESHEEASILSCQLRWSVLKITGYLFPDHVKGG